MPDSIGLGKIILQSIYKTNELLYVYERTESEIFKIDLGKRQFNRMLKKGLGPNELQNTNNISLSDSNTIFWGNSYTKILNEINLDGNLIKTKTLPELSAGFPSVVHNGKHYFKQPDNKSYQIIDDEGNTFVETPTYFRTFPTKSNSGFYVIGNKLHFMLAYEAVVHTLDLDTKEHRKFELELPIELNHFSSKYKQTISKKDAKVAEASSLKILRFIPFLGSNGEQHYLLYCFRKDVGAWLFVLDNEFFPKYNVSNFPYASYLTSFGTKVLYFDYDRETWESRFIEFEMK